MRNLQKKTSLFQPFYLCLRPEPVLANVFGVSQRYKMALSNTKTFPSSTHQECSERRELFVWEPST